MVGFTGKFNDLRMRFLSILDHERVRTHGANREICECARVWTALLR